MLWGYYSMVGSGLQPDFEYDYKCFLNVILNIFEIWCVLFNLSFGLYNTKCLSLYNCILTDFSSDGFLHIYYILPQFPTIPTDMLRFLLVPHAFLLMFCATRLQAQTGTKHERQCAPHDGRRATVCGDSRELLHCVENYSNNLF